MTDEAKVRTIDAAADGPHPQPAVQIWQWHPGVVAPPFISSNAEVVQLLLGMFDGMVGPPGHVI
jgi:hypothetical protein